MNGTIQSLGVDRPSGDLPLELARLHRTLDVGDRLVCRFEPVPDARWGSQMVVDLVAGAGFKLLGEPKTTGRSVEVQVERIHSLSDTVAPGMRLLVVGLNPSPYSSDRGVGYARPGNRFWPAALASGVASKDRDPDHALEHHGLGMTDLVRRTTARAEEVDPQEFSDGFARVERLVGWLTPGATCFVGLSGWRLVVDRRAIAGVQPQQVGDRPVYLMPHTSGLNAHSRLADLTDHLRAAGRLADDPNGAHF
ncbi:MAG: mismatch-specific DNA-glycosylase [Actinomycetota bacterium]|nr:mismatch-specific DNA-glycosylase [Actinomycetota bacterium]